MNRRHLLAHASAAAASPHTWGTTLKTVYTAHLIGAYGNAPTIEGVTTTGGNVGFGENKIVDARFHPSSQPGFGLSLPTTPLAKPQSPRIFSSRTTRFRRDG